jgi:hypothetical protein
MWKLTADDAFTVAEEASEPATSVREARADERARKLETKGEGTEVK